MTIECFICCNSGDYMTIGKCNHLQVCLVCSFKYRSDKSNHKCIVCNTPCEQVIVVPNPKISQDFKYSDFMNHNKVEFSDGIYYFDKEGKNACQNIKKICCPIKTCKHKKDVEMELYELKDHLKKDHRRYFCDLCLEHRKLLISEQKIYQKHELQVHMDEGDIDSEGIISIMHPYCAFWSQFHHTWPA